MSAAVDYGVVNGNKLRAVGEGRLYDDLVHHLRDALHHVIPVEYGDPEAHQVGDAASVAGAFEKLGAYDGDGLGVVEVQAAFAAAVKIMSFSCSMGESLMDPSLRRFEPVGWPVFIDADGPPGPARVPPATPSYCRGNPPRLPRSSGQHPAAGRGADLYVGKT